MSLAVASCALFGCLVVSGALLAHAAQIRAWMKPWGHSPAVPEATLEPLRFTPGDYTQALQSANLALPEGVITQILNLAGPGPGQRLLLKIRLPGEKHQNGRSTVTLDLTAGRVEAARDARAGGWPAAYDDFLYPFHTAYLAGAPHRLLWLLAGVALLMTSAAGFVSYTRRWRS